MVCSIQTPSHHILSSPPPPLLLLILSSSSFSSHLLLLVPRDRVLWLVAVTVGFLLTGVMVSSPFPSGFFLCSFFFPSSHHPCPTPPPSLLLRYQSPHLPLLLILSSPPSPPPPLPLPLPQVFSTYEGWQSDPVLTTITTTARWQLSDHNHSLNRIWTKSRSGFIYSCSEVHVQNHLPLHLQGRDHPELPRGHHLQGGPGHGGGELLVIVLLQCPWQRCTVAGAQVSRALSMEFQTWSQGSSNQYPFYLKKMCF